MDFRRIQELLRTARSGQIQQILATVLAIITAIGGLGLVGSTNNSPAGSSSTTPSDTGKADDPSSSGVPLASLMDNNWAEVGEVRIDGKQYNNAISYRSHGVANFKLGSRYSTLKVTVVNTQKPAGPAKLTIAGYTYTLQEGEARRVLPPIKVSNIDTLTTKAEGGKLVLVDARLY